MTEIASPDCVAGFPHPRESDRLIGHEAAEARLLEAFRNNYLHHAWLITGPKGIGKATLAYRFARFLLMAGEGEPASFPAEAGLAVPPDHPAARQIRAGAHGNLFVLNRQPSPSGGHYTRIRVDEVRALRPFLTHSPHRPGWRAVIVDSADEMNANAQNALLKSLEEPPERTVFLLVGAVPGALLATVRSRCQRLVLHPLSQPDLENVIARHLGDLAPADRALIGRLADGSPGRALTLAAEGGLDMCREIFELLKGLPAVDGERVHALGDRLAGRGNEASFHAFAELLSWWLTRLVRIGAAGLDGEEILAGEAELARRLIGGGGLEHWLEVWEKVTRLSERAEAVSLDRKSVTISAISSLQRAAHT